MTYRAADTRYQSMAYRRTGKSGLKLPPMSLGLWHNFGAGQSLQGARDLVLRAFDLGITHFDLANNYGPPAGSAETLFGQLLASDLAPYRDELIVTSKAGYDMWPGPYGDFGSRKYLISSLDQSLKRLGLDYVDIFYHHRRDVDTPLAETMGALDQIVRSGKALYVGLSNYDAADTREAAAILRDLGTPCLIHQPQYSMYARAPEAGLLDTLLEEGIGCVAFSPLAQGMLTDRYLNGIPGDSRAATAHFLRPENITEAKLTQIRSLNALAQQRGQTLAQMALAWVLRHPAMTSVIIGASRVSQLEDNLGALNNLVFSGEELSAIDAVLAA